MYKCIMCVWLCVCVCVCGRSDKSRTRDIYSNNREIRAFVHCHSMSWDDRVAVWPHINHKRHESIQFNVTGQLFFFLSSFPLHTCTTCHAPYIYKYFCSNRALYMRSAVLPVKCSVVNKGPN